MDQGTSVGRISRQRNTAGLWCDCYEVRTLELVSRLESDRLKARLGAALNERDLLNEKIAILEANRPLAHREFARLRPCAREQWLRRAFHPDAQREPVVGAALRDDRATAPGAAGAPGTCNATWLIERHGFITPTAFREEQLHSFAKAA